MNEVEILQRVFQLHSFRPGQQEIVRSLLAKKDTLIVMSTGGGKSICFQVPALLLPGTTIVVSPLISLMQDQVERLKAQWVAAEYLSSSLSWEHHQAIISRAKSRLLKLLYVSPETLLGSFREHILPFISVPLLVVDEAHCIVTWGEGFRPEYQCIPQLCMGQHQRPCIAAFTATAPPSLQTAIIQNLHLSSPAVFCQSIVRTNIHFRSIRSTTYIEKNIHLARLVQQHRHEPGLIYCSTRKACEVLYYYLQQWPQISGALKMFYYHAGLPATERADIQHRYLSGELNCIIATTAFGMGVDKSDIRWVIHYQPASSIENYFQEAGRAGRDRENSNCYLLYTPQDWIQLRKMFASDDTQRNRLFQQNLTAVKQYAETRNCRMNHLQAFFGERNMQPCHTCDNCTHWQPSISLHEQQVSARLSLLAQKYPFQPLSSSLNARLIEVLACYQPLPSQLPTLPGIGEGWLKKWVPILAQYWPHLWRFQPVRIPLSP